MTTRSVTTRYWAIVPAAGVGRRMANQAGPAVPKQYQLLLNRPMIEWSVSALLANKQIERVVVSIAPDDMQWPPLSIAIDSRVSTVVGGDERADSVMNALQALSDDAQPNDWVLVHDAARPCLHPNDISQLINTLKDDAVGGLLAAPVADTLKRVEAAQVIATVPREQLWRALTPQMFRYALLHRALAESQQKNLSVTDDASAVEKLGLRPKIIQGRADNIKVTVPEDLAIAAAVLRARLMEPQ
jgi:2-C-methyl-D-erythritol 4-phosphate cytidylyltransferase